MQAMFGLLRDAELGATLNLQELFGAFAERGCVGRAACEAVEAAQRAGALRERRDERGKVWFDVSGGREYRFG